MSQPLLMPDLEMLWEPDDPAAVLRERFGLDDANAAARWIAATLDQRWGIAVERCERIVMSDHNALAWLRTPTGRLIAKWSVAPHRFARLGALAELTAWLGRRGLPVSAPVAALDGEVQIELDAASLGVQRVLDGTLLDVADLNQVRTAGATLTQVQVALADYPYADRISATDSPEPLADTVIGWLAADHAHLPTALLDELRQRVSAAPPDPTPTQLVHGDFRSANVLWSDGRVVAVLDFEDAHLDHRVLGLAQSAVLIGTQFHDWGPVTPDIRAALLDGYRSECDLTPTELAWWDTLVLWMSLAMVPRGDDPTGWGAAATDAYSDLAEGLR